MTKKEMQSYRKKLMEMRDEIMNDMRKQEKNGLADSKAGTGGNSAGYSTHMADIGTDASEMEFTGNLLSSEQKTLFKIDEALLRIEEGTYGKCSGCKRPINKKRLEILPYARYCKKHEEERENPEG